MIWRRRYGETRGGAAFYAGRRDVGRAERDDGRGGVGELPTVRRASRKTRRSRFAGSAQINFGLNVPSDNPVYPWQGHFPR